MKVHPAYNGIRYRTTFKDPKVQIRRTASQTASQTVKPTTTDRGQQRGRPAAGILLRRQKGRPGGVDVIQYQRHNQREQYGNSGGPGDQRQVSDKHPQQFQQVDLTPAFCIRLNILRTIHTHPYFMMVHKVPAVSATFAKICVTSLISRIQAIFSSFCGTTRVSPATKGAERKLPKLTPSSPQ